MFGYQKPTEGIDRTTRKRKDELPPAGMIRRVAAAGYRRTSSEWWRPAAVGCWLPICWPSAASRPFSAGPFWFHPARWARKIPGCLHGNEKSLKHFTNSSAPPSKLIGFRRNHTETNEKRAITVGRSAAIGLPSALQWESGIIPIGCPAASRVETQRIVAETDGRLPDDGPSRRTSAFERQILSGTGERLSCRPEESVRVGPVI